MGNFYTGSFIGFDSEAVVSTWYGFNIESHMLTLYIKVRVVLP